jgi:hypothetical protein
VFYRTARSEDEGENEETLAKIAKIAKPGRRSKNTPIFFVLHSLAWFLTLAILAIFARDLLFFVTSQV